MPINTAYLLRCLLQLVYVLVDQFSQILNNFGLCQDRDQLVVFVQHSQAMCL